MSTKNKNTNDSSAKKNIRFEHELISQIETLKDPLIPFSAWVKRACREKLERDSSSQVPTNAPKTTHTATNTQKGAHVASGANEKRAAELMEKLTSEIKNLSPQQKAEIIGARYPKNSLFEAINGSVSKDSIRKYWNEVELMLKTG